MQARRLEEQRTGAFALCFSVVAACQSVAYGLLAIFYTAVCLTSPPMTSCRVRYQRKQLASQGIQAETILGSKQPGFKNLSRDSMGIIDRSAQHSTPSFFQHNAETHSPEVQIIVFVQARAKNLTMNMFKWGRTTAGKAGGGTTPPPGVPLELITYDTQTGKFELGAEALAVLRKVKGSVGVVAVSGRARQGKSYILNQLLGQSSGFTVASSHRPCTKGLWMWSTPVERQSPDGSKYHLVRRAL